MLRYCNMLIDITIGVVLFIAGLLGGIMLVDTKTPRSQRKITGNDEENESVNQKLRELDQGLTDLSDKVTHWMRRNNMRQLREQKETIQEEQPTESEVAEVTKQQLRQRAFNVRPGLK